MRGQRDVRPSGGEVAHGVPDLAPAGGIEARGRLVEQQQPGCADEAGTEIEAAALAPRVGAAAPVRDLFEAELLDHA